MAKIIISILLLISFKSEGQIALWHAHNVPPAFTFLLDEYPNAAVAYSFVKLRSAYSGNCIRVRRSSDNTEQDIGFVDNYLDTTSLKSFVGANDGFVQTWYDQSGNANDAIQNVNGSQPRIILSGTIERDDNGNVAGRFIDASGVGIEDYLALNSVPYAAGTTNIWTFNTYQPTTAGSFAQVWGSSANLRGFQTDHPSTNRTHRILTQRTGGLSLGTSTATYTDNVAFLQVMAANRTNLLGWVNNTSVISASDRNEDFNMPTATWIGNANEIAVQGNIKIVELIMFTSDQSSNRVAIQNIINAKYSIY